MNIIKPAAVIVMLALAVGANGQKPTAPTDGSLGKKLDAGAGEMVERFEGVMGVAIVDLTDGRTILHNADRVFPTASSIKIAILLELYRQEQEARGGAQGKAKLDDVYIFDPKDLVEDSQITAGLTAGVTPVTNRELAQFMIAVSDNAATNVLIDRVGKDNENAMLRNIGL